MSARIAVVTPDVVGNRMAGPGIRAYHFARELSKHFEVSLVALFEEEDRLDLDGIAKVRFGGHDAKRLLQEVDVAVGQPHRQTLRAARAGTPVIFDLFAPVLLELDQMSGGLRRRAHRFLETRRFREALRQGKRLIVATPAQRQLYEQLAERARIQIDPAGWLDVPFGIPAEDPPEVDQSSPPLVIWNGGVWPWLDPATAVAAIEEVNRRGTKARLSFMGTGRPNLEVAAALPELTSIGDSDLVEWNRDWVPYPERAGTLGRASVSLMLHGDTEEARYSIRTRLFDAIWCAIPVVATRGGFAAELVESENLGVVVPPGDVSSVADAIEALVKDDVLRSRSVSALMGVRDRYRWSEVCTPLIEAVESLAADRAFKNDERTDHSGRE
ncbi:MAG: glycosyltransferase family 4 protein [Thermoanaerobaculia bacterium]|nr:glycosyltransferase family 4 protein [Thermoanaerobaculia bacterium]